MSTESPAIRNYNGLEGLEELLHNAQLRINLGYGTVQMLQSGERISLMPSEIRTVGLSLCLNCEVSEFNAAAALASLKLTEIDLVVIAENGFLKDRQVLLQRHLGQLEETIEIVAHNKIRDHVLRDKKHGFTVRTYLVLNKDIEHLPFRPRRLGTILAQESFSISPSKIGQGLRPKPMTSDVISVHGLKKGSLLYVYAEGSLLDAETLDDAISVYIDEDIFNSLGVTRTSDSKLLQTIFALDTLVQLAYLVSAELNDQEGIGPDLEDSVVVVFIFEQLQQILGKNVLNAERVVHLLKSDPQKIAALLSGARGVQSSLKSWIMGTEE
jgi:hypothetical protein